MDEKKLKVCWLLNGLKVLKLELTLPSFPGC